LRISRSIILRRLDAAILPMPPPSPRNDPSRLCLVSLRRRHSAELWGAMRASHLVMAYVAVSSFLFMRATTTCKRSARALFRRQVPTPSNTPRPHPRSLIPNCGRYQHVFHPDRNKSSTPTGTQAALIHTDSPFVPSTIPRGNWPMNTVECRSGSRRAERGRPPRPPCEVSSHPRTGFAMPGRT